MSFAGENARRNRVVQGLRTQRGQDALYANFLGGHNLFANVPARVPGDRRVTVASMTKLICTFGRHNSPHWPIHCLSKQLFQQCRVPASEIW